MSHTNLKDDPRDDEFPVRPSGSGGGLVVGLLVAGGLVLVLVFGGLAYVLMARGAVRDRQTVVAAREAESVEVHRPQAVVAPPKAMAGPLVARAAGVPIIDGGDGHRILNDFLADPAAAEAKWLGKRVRLKQRAERVDGDKRGFYLVLACGAHVYAAAGQADRLGAVEAGDSVEVEATLTRFIAADGPVFQLPVIEAEAGRLIVNHGPDR